jgi:hypothetical protein
MTDPGCVIKLPAPISTNALWIIRRNKRTGAAYMSRSPLYVRWLKDCGWVLNGMKIEPIKGWYALTLFVGTGSRIDLDNACKSAQDLLQHYGVIENDRYCAMILMMWAEHVEGLEICVAPANAPAGKEAA